MSKHPPTDTVKRKTARQDRTECHTSATVDAERHTSATLDEEG
jgi:hypothetical protein